MDIYRGYKIKGRKGLSHWSSLLEEWMLSIERYTRILEGNDAPYCYNERANIGVLSGAAWKAGWISLEEFQSQKGHVNHPKVNGRTDLYLCNDSDESLIEAKFKWVCMGSDKLLPMVKNTMEKAIDDAKKTRANNTDIKTFGVRFFPVYKKESTIDDKSEMIELTIADFELSDYHALAWCISC